MSDTSPEPGSGETADLIFQKTDPIGDRLIWALIAICVLIELALQAAAWGLIDAPRLRQIAFDNAGFWPGLLQDWRPNYALQPYAMFATYGFFHSGFLHLVVNMITLISLGRAVQHRVGWPGFSVLYLATILGGAGGYALLAPGLQPMVGASGALFGLAGALLAWMYVDRYTHQEGILPVAQAVVILILLNLVMWWAMNGQLAWQTHLGGFLTGWVMALLVDPRPRAADPFPQATDHAAEPPAPESSPAADP